MNGFSLLLLDILLSQAFLALPDIISANLSQRAWTHTPAAPKVPSLVSSLRASAFPDLAAGRRSTISWTATSVQGVFSGLQPFRHVQARQFACHPGGSHRYALSRRRAAVASTSGHPTVRYLPVVQIG